MTKRGFTMIELLVVIVIIGILAALVVPGVNKALIQARFAESQSNLHQIGLALMLHAQDYDGKLPIARADLPYIKDRDSVAESRWSWQMQLIPYTSGNEKIFFSPYAASFSPKAKQWSYFLGSHAAGVEGMAQSPPELFQPLNLNKIKAPSQHILAGEVHINSIFKVDDSDKDDYDRINPAFGYAGADRKVNILFADGHIESPKRFDAKKMAVKYEGIDPTYTGYE